MSTSQPFGHNVVPSAVGRENSPDPDDVPIVDLGESDERDPSDGDPVYEGGVPVGAAEGDKESRSSGDSIEPDPVYEDDAPVGAADADEDARRAGGSR
jgi:hypothetical protein